MPHSLRNIRPQIIYWEKFFLGSLLSITVLSACRAQVKPVIGEAAPSANPLSKTPNKKSPASGATMSWFRNEPLRTHFQSHQIVTLRIAPDLLSEATSFTLLNVTGLSLEDDGGGEPLFSDFTIPEKSVETPVPGHPELTLTHDDRGLWVKIYPVTGEGESTALRERLSWGEYRLKAILSDQNDNQHTVYFALTIRDFSIAEPSWTHSFYHESGVPESQPSLRQGGLRWWVNSVGNSAPTLSKHQDKGEMTTGLYNIIK